jgi:two-component system response regulator AtoC
MAVILVVDDDPDVVQLLRGILNRALYRSDSAFDGVEAVLKVVERDYDAVLMDVKMPKLDGIDALKIIRAVKPNLPVIMFSGGPTQAERGESERLGATGFLAKPVQIEELVESLKVALLNLSSLGLPLE